MTGKKQLLVAERAEVLEGYVLFLENSRTGKIIRIGLYKTSLDCYKAFEKLEEKGYIFKGIHHSNELKSGKEIYVTDRKRESAKGAKERNRELYAEAVKLMNQGYSAYRAAMEVGVDYGGLKNYMKKEQVI